MMPTPSRSHGMSIIWVKGNGNLWLSWPKPPRLPSMPGTWELRMRWFSRRAFRDTHDEDRPVRRMAMVHPAIPEMMPFPGR